MPYKIKPLKAGAVHAVSKKGKTKVLSAGGSGPEPRKWLFATSIAAALFRDADGQLDPTKDISGNTEDPGHAAEIAQYVNSYAAAYGHLGPNRLRWDGVTASEIA